MIGRIALRVKLARQPDTSYLALLMCKFWSWRLLNNMNCRIRILALLWLIVMIIASLMSGDEKEFQGCNQANQTDYRIVILLLLIDAFNLAWEDEQDLHQPNNCNAVNGKHFLPNVANFDKIHPKLTSPEEFPSLNSKFHDFVWDNTWPLSQGSRVTSYQTTNSGILSCWIQSQIQHIQFYLKLMVPFKHSNSCFPSEGVS